MCTTQSVKVDVGTLNWLAPAAVIHVAHIAATGPAGLGAFTPAGGASLLGLETIVTLPPHGVSSQYSTARVTASATGFESTIGRGAATA